MRDGLPEAGDAATLIDGEEVEVSAEITVFSPMVRAATSTEPLLPISVA